MTRRTPDSRARTGLRHRRRLLAGALALLAAPAAASAASLADGGPVDLLTEANVRIAGQGTFGFAGYSVDAAGDVNGDGIGDILVGAPYVTNNGRTNAGSAYVVYGSAALTDISLASLGTAGFRIDGATDSDLAGYSVAAAGDVNGDGFADVIVGAPKDGLGSAYVILGAATRTNIDLASIPAGAGFAIHQTSGAERAGAAVAGAGDVNGDGFDDVIVGAPGAVSFPFGNSGAYVVFGGATPVDVDLANLSGHGFRVQQSTGDQRLGHAVAGGDLNGDQYADIVVTARGSDAAYIVFGTSAPTDVVVGTSGTTLTGDPSANFGWSAAVAGDINNDGRDDLVIGAPSASDGASQAGAAHVYLGRAFWPSGMTDGDADIHLAGTVANGGTGRWIAPGGDLNGDGRDDLVVGSPSDGTAGTNAGSADIVYGSASLTGTVLLSTLGTGGVHLSGTAGDNAGSSVAGGADVTGDGHPDLIIGAPPASTNVGRAYVVAGFGPPVNAVAPGAPAGTARMGGPLTMNSGTWLDSVSLIGQWQRCDATGGACAGYAGSSTTITPTAADVGATFRANVSAVNAHGTSALTSPPSAIIAPASTATPAITGTPAPGEVLGTDNTATHWGGVAGLDITYRWIRNGADIPGANGATYAVGSADRGATLTLVIGASKNGSAITTVETAAVTVAAPTAPPSQPPATDPPASTPAPKPAPTLRALRVLPPRGRVRAVRLHIILNGRARVRGVIERRIVVRRSRTKAARWRVARRVTGVTNARGQLTRTLGRIPPGRYRVRLVLRSSAGARATVTRMVTVRR